MSDPERVVFSAAANFTGDVETHVEQDEAQPVPGKPGVFVSATSSSIFTAVDDVLSYRHGDPRFYGLLSEIAALHARKSFDYTPAGDPLANFHRSERFGVPAWKGALVRIGDKLGRLEQLASGKEPANESMRDTLVDTAVYALLTVLLLEDAK